jgi:DNA-binding transcriptional regulator GbsR (MarR family)
MSTKEGLIYASRSYNASDQSVLCIGDLLYVRDSTQADSPLMIYDKNSLDKVEDESLKKVLAKTKRNTDKHDWNSRIYEVTNEQDFTEAVNKGGHGQYRKLHKSPLFSEGKNLYVVATYYEKPETDFSIDTMQRSFSVEIYDPLTLTLLNRTQLILEPDKESLTKEEEQKINDATEGLKNSLQYTELDQLSFMTNGKDLALVWNNKMHFFSLQTGRRYRSTIDLPSNYCGYSPLTNTFWCFASYS